jgi:hypothetical protein
MKKRTRDMVLETSRSCLIREKLSHPVVDSDGHWLEPKTVWAEYIRKLGGSEAAGAFLKMQREQGSAWYRMSAEERQRRRQTRPGWWGAPANTLDRATALLPGFMYERLDQFGIDFSVILPTSFGVCARVPDPVFRKLVARAANVMHAEMWFSSPFRGESDDDPAAAEVDHRDERRCRPSG